MLISETTQPETQKIRLICQAAQLVLENGGETYRVEETALRMASGLGLSDVNIVAFPTSIFVSVGGLSRIRRVTHRGTNTSRLARVNDVSRKVEHGLLSADEAEAELAAIAADPGLHQLTLIAAYGVSAASFSLVFGGGLGTLLVGGGGVVILLVVQDAHAGIRVFLGQLQVSLAELPQQTGVVSRRLKFFIGVFSCHRPHPFLYRCSLPM